MKSEWLISVAAFLAAASMTGLVRSYALRRGMLDHPNVRSSHSIPTPRGGGLSIVFATILSALTLFTIGRIEATLMHAVVFGGIPVAIIGYIDDRRSVQPRVRLLVHLCVAAFVTWLLGGTGVMQIGGNMVMTDFIGDALAVIAIIWAVNFFNFMDGIDGIAASEAVFVCIAGAFLTSSAWDSGTIAVALVVSAASLGFLIWNWPPAKIFMGDAGSGFLGFVIAVLALNSAHTNPTAIFEWLILGSVFFIDATVTLVRRVMRGEKASVAHRSHAYQWLSRRFGSHLKVTLLVQAINVGWLLPLAIACKFHPSLAVYLLLVALVPLAFLAVACGAGRPESAG